MFQQGQRVICIGRPKTLTIVANANYPDTGRIYTVRAVNVWLDRVQLRFFELDNRHLIGVEVNGVIGNIEPGFNAKYFRPLQQFKTDISVFTKLLDDTRAKEPA